MGCRLVDDVPQIVDERSLDIAGGSRAAGSSVRVLAAADRNLQGMSHQANIQSILQQARLFIDAIPGISILRN